MPAGPSHLIGQRIAHAVGTEYRVSAWIRTEGVTTAPRLNVVFYNTGGGILTSALVGSVVSESEYAFVSKDLATVPAGTVTIGLNLQYGGTVADKVYLDNALIEPIP